MNKILKHVRIKTTYQYDINGNNIDDMTGWYEEYTIDDGFCYLYHREDGPARLWEGGYKRYYLDGNWFKDIKSDEEWIIKQLLE